MRTERGGEERESKCKVGGWDPREGGIFGLSLSLSIFFFFLPKFSLFLVTRPFLSH